MPAGVNRRASLRRDAACFSEDLGFGCRCRSWGVAMKLTPTREAMPLSVWIALVVMALGAVIYLTGVVVVDDIMAFISDKK